MRTPTTIKKYNEDLTVPLDKSKFMEDSTCFGKHWDMRSKECPQCADRDICGIVFKDTVDKKAKDIESDLGTKYLDVADFDNLTIDKVKSFVKSGETTSKDLLAYAMEVAYCDDVLAVKNKLMALLKKDGSFKIKEGIVWEN